MHIEWVLDSTYYVVMYRYKQFITHDLVHIEYCYLLPWKSAERQDFRQNKLMQKAHQFLGTGLPNDIATTGLKPEHLIIPLPKAMMSGKSTSIKTNFKRIVLLIYFD